MPSTCPKCQGTFKHWTDYHEHLALGCAFSEVQNAIAELKVISTGRTDLGRKSYSGPMSKAEKARIVAKGEARLGTQYFMGGF